MESHVAAWGLFGGMHKQQGDVANECCLRSFRRKARLHDKVSRCESRITQLAASSFLAPASTLAGVFDVTDFVKMGLT